MIRPGEKRRFAAILALDVVGYSNLTEQDELGTVRAVRRLRSEILGPALSATGGRLVKTMGDGFLAEFTSPDAALTAAMDIQDQTIAAAAELPPGQRMILRIGAHVGDVIVDDEDILGDGVNIAARLETLAHPGGIAASGSFARALTPGLTARLSDDGEHRVKNITRPLHVWRWQAEGLEGQVAVAPPVARPPTVAVLPFANRSPDKEQAYFAEGLAEDIVSALQHMARLPVVSAASSLSLDPDLALQDKARVLGARYLVQGAVRRAGQNVRVIVELIEGDSGHSLWSEKYDRAFDDVFEIQDDITLRVVTALDAELVEGEIDRVRRQRPDQPGAWEHYLRGTAHLRNPNVENLLQAQNEFKAALAIDPGYGEAWSSLGWAYLKEFGFGLSDDPQAILQKGYEATMKGVELSDKSPFAHYALSTAYVWRKERELSLKELEQAIRLNPWYTRARVALLNRRELSDPSLGIETAEELRKALALSPREPDRGFYFWSIARIYLVAGEALEALDWADRAVSVRPSDPNMLFRRAICLAALDRVEDARAALEASEALTPGFLESRLSWRPYEDARDDILFAGLRRHRLGGWQ
jgi:class 3 adenylate cyclase/tetratricopeptide (TPR) repeat protein